MVVVKADNWDDSMVVMKDVDLGSYLVVLMEIGLETETAARRIRCKERRDEKS